MPSLTIVLSQKCVDRLKHQVRQTNAATRTDFDLVQWLELHLHEMAIADDLTAAVQRLQEEQQKDAQATLNAAIVTTRDELIADLQS